jgi:cation diffusion facilitator CzcD-associated flavoprotein CzcO
VETSLGVIEAQRIVAATGPFQRPVIPAIAPQDSAVQQIHSAHYFNPQQLPEGGVLVVGAGSSGVQIADELRRAGRAVWLSVGAHDRPPRRYRQRDFCWWLGVLGLWDAAANQPGKEHVTIAVSGARGGHTVDFRQLAHQGLPWSDRRTALPRAKPFSVPIWRTTFVSATPPIWRCSTPRMSISLATGCRCRKSRKRAFSCPTPIA